MHRPSYRGWILLRGRQYFEFPRTLLIMLQMALPDNAAVEHADHKPLETIVNSIVKEKQVFERLTLSKDDL
jgi:hypothetical protein